MDRTPILVKPDAFERRLTGEIIARFERKGLTIVAMRQMTVERDLAERHYAEHRGKPFFGDLVEFITGGPLVAMVLTGHEAVSAARQVIGATDPPSRPCSIRGDFGLEVQTNLALLRLARICAVETALFFPNLVALSRERVDRDPLILALALAAAEGDPRCSAWRSGSMPDVEELRLGDPRAVVTENARRKARATPGERVLAVDTAVVLDGRIYGKPGDAAEAELFLRRLSGRRHEVLSGITLRGAPSAPTSR